MLASGSPACWARAWSAACAGSGQGLSAPRRSRNSDLPCPCQLQSCPQARELLWEWAGSLLAAGWVIEREGQLGHHTRWLAAASSACVLFFAAVVEVYLVPHAERDEVECLHQVIKVRISATFLELRQVARSGIDRDGEGNADVTSVFAAGLDLRVDADHFALFVE